MKLTYDDAVRMLRCGEGVVCIDERLAVKLTKEFPEVKPGWYGFHLGNFEEPALWLVYQTEEEADAALIAEAEQLQKEIAEEEEV